MKKLNNSEVKKHNKRLVYRALLNGGKKTKAELAAQTHLSIPTISQILNELTEFGFVEEVGMQSSEGGRRPVSLSAKADVLLAGGMEVSQHHLCMCVVNLRGECRAFERVAFSGEDAALNDGKKIAETFRAFLAENDLTEQDLIGIGVALPGIVDQESDTLIYSHVLGLEKPHSLDHLRKAFSIKLSFFNDATAACLAECYTEQVPESFSFVSLGNSVGGAMVIRGEIVSGVNGRNGEAGHMLIHPKGKMCYCGRAGHYDPYGSALILSDAADGSLQDFFAGLEQGNKQFADIFETYLSDLALLIYNLHVYMDLPVLLGGYVGAYLSPYLDALREKVCNMDLFSDKSDFIGIGRYRYEAASVGCARYFLEKVIDEL